jgi:hypothetical protein
VFVGTVVVLVVWIAADEVVLVLVWVVPLLVVLLLVVDVVVDFWVDEVVLVIKVLEIVVVDDLAVLVLLVAPVVVDVRNVVEVAGGGELVVPLFVWTSGLVVELEEVFTLLVLVVRLFVVLILEVEVELVRGFWVDEVPLVVEAVLTLEEVLVVTDDLLMLVEEEVAASLVVELWDVVVEVGGSCELLDVLEILTLEVELVVDFAADEELLVVEAVVLVVILIDLVTLVLVVELCKTDEVEEVLALLPVLVWVVLEVLALDDEVGDVFGSDEVLLVVEIVDECVLVVLVDLVTLLVAVPLVDVIAGAFELLVVPAFWTTEEVELALELVLDVLTLEVEVGFGSDEVLPLVDEVLVVEWILVVLLEDLATLVLVATPLVVELWDVVVVEPTEVAVELWDVVEVVGGSTELLVVPAVCASDFADELEEVWLVLEVVLILDVEVVLVLGADEVLVLDEVLVVEWVLVLAVVVDLVTFVLLVALVELVEVGSDEVVEVRAAWVELDVALSEDEVDETLVVLVVLDLATLVLLVALLVVELALEVVDEEVLGPLELVAVLDVAKCVDVFEVVEEDVVAAFWTKEVLLLEVEVFVVLGLETLVLVVTLLVELPDVLVEEVVGSRELFVEVPEVWTTDDEVEEVLRVLLIVDVEVVVGFWLDEVPLVAEVLLLVLDLMMALDEVVTLLVEELLPEVTVEEAVVCWELVVVAASGDVELVTFWEEEALLVLVDEIVGGSVLVVDDLVTLVLAVELWDVDVEAVVECRVLVVELELLATEDDVDEVLILVLEVLDLLVLEVLEADVVKAAFKDDEAVLLFVVLVDVSELVFGSVLVVVDLATLVLTVELFDVDVEVVLVCKALVVLVLVLTSDDEVEDAFVLEVLAVEVEDAFCDDEVLVLGGSGDEVLVDEWLVLVVLDLGTLVKLWTVVEVVVACWDVVRRTCGDEDEEVLTLVVLVELALPELDGLDEGEEVLTLVGLVELALLELDGLNTEE